MNRAILQVVYQHLPPPCPEAEKIYDVYHEMMTSTDQQRFSTNLMTLQALFLAYITSNHSLNPDLHPSLVPPSYPFGYIWRMSSSILQVAASVIRQAEPHIIEAFQPVEDILNDKSCFSAYQYQELFRFAHEYLDPPTNENSLFYHEQNKEILRYDRLKAWNESTVFCEDIKRMVSEYLRIKSPPVLRWE